MTLSDCDTLQFSIEFYGVYRGGQLWDTGVPFVDPPDAELPLAIETYPRMQTPL